MPPFISQVDMYRAYENQAIPVLEALAANDALHEHSLRRFERDDPPPYTSSTESGEFNEEHWRPPPKPSLELPDEMIAIMEPPLSDSEREDLLDEWRLRDDLLPIRPYHAEAKIEERRVEDDLWAKPDLRRNAGHHRVGVIVRHNIKRRWQQLGVWNSAWGIAGRNVDPRDDAYKWKWRWEPEIADEPGSGDEEITYTDQLLMRVLHRRQHLRRGEKGLPVRAHSRLKPDATASEAESFLTSRPWFLFQLELIEERLRYERNPMEQRSRHPYRSRRQVIEWWKQRGDWPEESEGQYRPSWKWRHESPSPEPVDLTPMHNLPNRPESGLNVFWNPTNEWQKHDNPMETIEMDFTPSEMEDFETITRPLDERPENFWGIPSFLDRFKFPGAIARLPSPPIVHSSRPATTKPYVNLFSKSPLFALPPSEEDDEALWLQEYQASLQARAEDPPEPQRDPASPPPQEPRYKRKRQRRDTGDRVRDHPSPPLRRSPRIAAVKRSAEPQPSPATSNKRTRVGAPAKAAAPAAQPATREPRPTKRKPVPARPPPKGEAETPPRRGRRRSSSENGPSTRSAGVEKKPARKPPRVRAGKA